MTTDNTNSRALDSGKSSPIPKSTSPLEKSNNVNNAKVEQSFDQDSANDGESEIDGRSQAPLQKRRRVTRACDECRRKKIKCDGKQSCSHCQVYGYQCTYDQPSNRRRNPAPQYIESLERRLQKAEAILQVVLPGLNFDDPRYNVKDVEQILESHKMATSLTNTIPEDDAQMRSMVDRTGSLDLDDTGYYDYHGNSSGYSFMRRFRAQFGDDFLPNPKTYDHRNLINVQTSPKSFHSSPYETSTAYSQDLPPKDVAIRLCKNALDDCCALQRPLHRPTFFARLNAVYSKDSDTYTDEETKFLPIMYSAMAVGCLFGATIEDHNDPAQKGYKHATEQGYQYFNVAKSMLDVTDCRDLLSIQAVMLMILFLQGTAKLATCYSYIGVALRSCCRLGMHRKITGKFSIIEQEERKRIFWQIRKMDTYVGAMLGLPQMLGDEDVDQELPTEVNDERITESGIFPNPQDAFPLMKATNAHSKLLSILKKVVHYVYPVKPPIEGQQAGEYTISHSLIRELERDLQNWMEELPSELKPSDQADLELARVQQLLRMSYAYVQMMIYRPFLHYVAQSCQSARTDKRSFACAAACVSVARNIVHITSEMKRRSLLNGAYWFVMYTTYFAILSLLYFVLENPESSTSKDILKDAMEGRDTLANLATKSMAADRCTSSLTGLFEALPEKLNERRSSLRTATMPNTSRKRPPPAYDPPFFGNASAPISQATSQPSATDAFSSSLRTRTMPQEFLKNATKRMSMPDPVSAPVHFSPEPTFSNIGTPTETVGFGSSNSGTPGPLDFGTPALNQGRLPDLKSVMFPGDNPFAYPNQPISTLDNMPNLPFGNNIQSTESFNLPDQNNTNNRHQYSVPYINQPDFSRNMQNSVPQTSSQYFTMNDMTDEPGQLNTGGAQNNLQVPGQVDENDYWSHAPAKGQFRTGLTPGGPAVSLDLDDIFGNAQGWTMPMNLTMPDMNQRQDELQWNPQGQNW